MAFFPVTTSTGYTGKYNVLLELSFKKVGEKSQILSFSTRLPLILVTSLRYTPK